MTRRKNAKKEEEGKLVKLKEAREATKIKNRRKIKYFNSKYSIFREVAFENDDYYQKFLKANQIDGLIVTTIEKPTSPVAGEPLIICSLDLVNDGHYCFDRDLRDATSALQTLLLNKIKSKAEFCAREHLSKLFGDSYSITFIHSDILLKQGHRQDDIKGFLI